MLGTIPIFGWIFLKFLLFSVTPSNAQNKTLVMEQHLRLEGMRRNLKAVFPVSCSASGRVNNNLFELVFSKQWKTTEMRFRIKDLNGLKNQLKKEDCIARGKELNWHIHTKDDGGDGLEGLGIGSDECNKGTVGGHYDPTLACGPSTGNAICAANQIPPSSALDKATAYSCSVDSYTNQDPLACELGDLSGKYGKLIIPATGDIDVDLFISDPADIVNPCNLLHASIVIHCAGSTEQAVCLELEKVGMSDYVPPKKCKSAAFKNKLSSVFNLCFGVALIANIFTVV